MDMDPSSGQSQEMQLGQQASLENMLVCSKSGQDQRKARPAPEQALKCPRCDSTNTKFCYYNNYSLTQPRYFCKSCRRYWTKGGTLRNVPVGGGCRKNKRSSSSSTSSTPTSSASSKLRVVQDQPHPLIGSTHLLPPNLSYDSNDLTLAFARLQKQQSSSNGHHLGYASDFLGNPNFLDALRSGFLDTSTTTTNSHHHHQLQNLYYGVNGNYGMGDQVDENGEIVVMPYDHQEDHDKMINGGGSSGATTQAVTVTTMKQELCNNNNNNNSNDSSTNYNNNYGATTNVRSEDDQSKVLWGFPWQMNGNNNDNNNINININNMGHDHHHHLDHSAAAGRSSESWINGINGGSTWHGLLNSPLM